MLPLLIIFGVAAVFVAAIWWLAGQDFDDWDDL